MIKAQENNKVVYLHKKKGTDEVVYVGIGSPTRPFDFEGRNPFWKKIEAKYGIDVEVVHDGLTWEQACLIEIALIKAYGRRDLGSGTLCNLTDGGDGLNGYVASDELRKKRSDAVKGEKHHFYGKKRPEQGDKLRGKKRPEAAEKLKYGNNGKAKLTYEQILNVIDFYGKEVLKGRKRGIVQKIAEMYDVSYTCIYDICVRKRTWNY